jgi:hypothetical protein
MSCVHATNEYAILISTQYSIFSVVVKALRYKSEGPGIDSPCCRGFFPCHLTVSCALGSTQPLKMSTRIILVVKAVGA